MATWAGAWRRVDNIRSHAELLASPLRGPIFETAVYCELRKRLAPRQELESLFFFRDRTREVDFVLHRGGRFHLLECKWTEIPTARDAAGMEHVAGALGPRRVTSRTLVCRTPRPHPLGPEVLATNLEELEV